MSDGLAPSEPCFVTSSVQEQYEQPDPTLEYSSLLIAKPLPFRMDLRVRNQSRADHVARQWNKLTTEGEFQDEKCFWRGGNAGDNQYGWGKVWL